MLMKHIFIEKMKIFHGTNYPYHQIWILSLLNMAVKPSTLRQTAIIMFCHSITTILKISNSEN